MLKKVEKLNPAEEAILAVAESLLASDAKRAQAARTCASVACRRAVSRPGTIQICALMKAFGPLVQAPAADGIASFLAAHPAICEAVRLPFLDGHFLAEQADALPKA
ncbi:MAG: hypothetical protein R3D29_14355 [Nitratireductor sp.]